MILTHQQPFSVGKFLVSAWSSLTETGEYSASISIRSGRGMGTHDRVFRMQPLFSSDRAALEYATREGRALALQHGLA